MLSYALIARKALSYITFGQDVPGDFAVIDPKKLIEGTLSVKQGDTGVDRMSYEGRYAGQG